MIILDLKINNEFKKVKIKDEILFNAVLAEHPNMIKKLIKSVSHNYKISDSFFTIINKYIDFTEDGISLYPGLIIRTGLYNYAVLYLEQADIDEEYMIELIKEYIHDTDSYSKGEINIDAFEIDKKTFLNATKSI